MLNKTSSVKVSVCVVTYNQEQYITQCLQSLVEQVTDFEFEIIVGNDASKDKTQDIIGLFQSKYPKIIKVINHLENVGASNNFFSVHSIAKGQYIAHLDGDDYILPGKLQKQSDFMDLHPNCNLSWHRVLVQPMHADTICDDLLDWNLIPKEGFSQRDILKYIAIGMNSSKMYREGTMAFPLPDFPMLDYFANVEQVGNGKAMFVSNEPLGVYRAGIGIASNDKKIKAVLKNTFDYFLKKYPYYHSDINQAVLVLMVAALKNFRIREFILFFPVYIRSFSLRSFFGVYADMKLIKMLRIPKG
jgi:glycosyltransferase involved in cell wall biosynthesis